MAGRDAADRYASLRIAWLAGSSALWYPIHQWSSTVGALWAVASYFVVRYLREVILFWRTVPRDVAIALASRRAQRALDSQLRRSVAVAQLFTETADRFPHKTFMSFGDSAWTFARAREFTNQLANHFRGVGLRPGDEVALVMENRPEFVMIWLGLSKLGVVTALINYNLKSEPLAHCINVTRCKAVIFSGSLSASIESAAPYIENGSAMTYYHWDDKPSAGSSLESQNLRPAVEAASSEEVIHSSGPSDRLLYIFTSGTTGLPKAAIITNRRFMYVAANMVHMCGFTTSDKIYLSLPLYHNSGGILGPGPCIVYGLSCHIAPKFSASRFWTDCEQNACTIALYIGEMIRYLLAQPERDTDQTHGVRMLYGHGARKQLWEQFQQRFGVRDIREIYGSTEGNAGLLNTDNTPGAIGFLPTVCRLSRTIARTVHPVFVIRVDPESGQPVRNHHGLCVECAPGEPGELIGLITANASMKFEGYVDREATLKKVYCDVFRRGETAFATGDIVVYDELGYLYFQDRTGDTFRWKSENVSTNQVEGVVAKILGYTDAIVYGVAVEGTEGKAGMVAILNKASNDGDSTIDLSRFLAEMQNALPAYAIPLFVRFIERVESTTTLKYKKTDFVKEGFDPIKVNDPLFFLDAERKQYVPLDSALHTRIVSGQVRL